MLKYTVWQPGRHCWWISNGRRLTRNIHTFTHARTHSRHARASTPQACSNLWGMKTKTLVFFLFFLELPLLLSSPCSLQRGGDGGKEGGGLLFSSISPENPRTSSKYVRHRVVYYWFELFIIHTQSLAHHTPPSHRNTHISLVLTVSAAVPLDRHSG